MPVTTASTTTLVCDLCAATVTVDKIPGEWWGATNGNNAIGMLGLTRGPESSMTRLVICPDCIEPLLAKAIQMKKMEVEAGE